MASMIKTLSDLWDKKVKSNPYVIFILAVSSVWGVVEKIIKTIKMFQSLNISELPIFSWGFAADVLQIITVYIVFRLYKNFLSSIRQINKVDEDRVRQINENFEYVTNNLNDSHRILTLKIRYVDLKVENPKLTNDQFIDKLHEAGFSEDDLKEIGVDKNFILANNGKLLSKKVLEKYKAFKDELHAFIKDKNK